MLFNIPLQILTLLISRPLFFILLPANVETKGTFHAEIGTVEDRNSMDLTEAEDIKNTQKNIHRRTIQKNTQKNYSKKIFMTQITTMV